MLLSSRFHCLQPSLCRYYRILEIRWLRLSMIVAQVRGQRFGTKGHGGHSRLRRLLTWGASDTALRLLDRNDFRVAGYPGVSAIDSHKPTCRY